MIELSNYIEKKFSEELKLNILLSQEELNLQELSITTKQIDWDSFLKLAVKHRLISQIHKNIKYLEKITPPEIIERFKQVKLDQTAKALNFITFVLKIHQLLKEKNIQHCFFKGPLLSYELYQDIGFRNFGDIDMLVEIARVEEAKKIIEDIGFRCINPSTSYSDRQKKINYTISHHYFFRNEINNVNVELHWNISNPKSFFNIETDEILTSSEIIQVSNTDLPYISRTINLVYLAAHGSVHQWFRLFWIKDFSVLLSKTSAADLKNAIELSKKLRLEKSFYQACQLANLLYKNDFPDFIKTKITTKSYSGIPLKSIRTNELKFRGIGGKILFVFYKLQLKKSVAYYFDSVFRLRTHPTDWELIKLPDKLFPLYYLLRPFLLIYKSFVRK